MQARELASAEHNISVGIARRRQTRGQAPSPSESQAGGAVEGAAASHRPFKDEGKARLQSLRRRSLHRPFSAALCTEAPWSSHQNRVPDVQTPLRAVMRWTGAAFARHFFGLTLPRWPRRAGRQRFSELGHRRRARLFALSRKNVYPSAPRKSKGLASFEANPMISLVGAAGFELATPCTPFKSERTVANEHGHFPHSNQHLTISSRSQPFV